MRLTRSLAKYFAPAFGGLVAVGAAASSVYAQVTLPDLGVDTAGHVTAAGTELGTVIAACFGVFIVLLVVAAAYRWLRRSRSG